MAIAGAERPMTRTADTVRYDDRTPRLFFLAAIVWAVVGMLVGVLIAAMLFMPALNSLADALLARRAFANHLSQVFILAMGVWFLWRALG